MTNASNVCSHTARTDPPQRLCAAYGGLEAADVIATAARRLDELIARGRHVEIYAADAAHLRSGRA